MTTRVLTYLIALFLLITLNGCVTGSSDFDGFVGSFIDVAHAETTYRGKASWYSSESECREDPCVTANGSDVYWLERFNPYWGAMRTEPFNSWWRVKNINNNRSVLIPILDRGPSDRYPDRVIDLSEEAFAYIEDPDKGLADVVVERIK